MALHDVSEATFGKEVLESNLPVVVDFWAPWCGPCRMMAPVLEQYANSKEGQVKVVKVNVDDNPGLAGRFNVMGIPTLLVFEGGQPVGQMVGYVPLNELQRKVSEALGAKA